MAWNIFTKGIQPYNQCSGQELDHYHLVYDTSWGIFFLFFFSCGDSLISVPFVENTFLSPLNFLGIFAQIDWLCRCEFISVSLLFLMVPFDKYKFLNLTYTNVKISLLLQLVLIVSYLWNVCLLQGHEDILMYFLLKAYCFTFHV